MKEDYSSAGKIFYTAVTAALLFILISLAVFVFREWQIDKAVFDMVKDRENAATTRFMLFITYWGKHSFLVPANLALLAAFLLLKKYHWALRVAFASLGGVALMGLLKNLFGRQRPPEPLVDGITNNSYPSGHAMMSVLFYGLLALFCIIYIANRRMKWMMVFLLLLFMLLIGFSRIYLRVHYTTDVLAGFSFGVFWLCVSFWLAQRITKRKTQGL